MANDLIKFVALFVCALMYLSGSFWGMEIAKSAGVQPWVVGISAVIVQTALMLSLGVGIFGRAKLDNNPSNQMTYVGFAIMTNSVCAYGFSGIITAGNNLGAWMAVIFSILTAYLCFMILVIADGPAITFARRA